LGDLDEGDEFTLTYNNVDYKYVVDGVKELKPKEVKPLADIRPKYLNQNTVVLMTCSPAGTKINRLLIEAVEVT
jgi:LPXTG-site transpeptidase (sortase) family protein